MDTRVVLDEESSVLPATVNGVDVRVKRTIKANTWSSIVLPFSMSNEQVKAAFGDDVEVAEFTGWEQTEDDGISVGFLEVNEIEANIPYIIKVSSVITEFVADAVDIQADEDPCVTVGKYGRGTFGSFTGSYVPITIEEENLFLSDNKFWYSTGLTQMNGYRAYFYFQTVLDSYNTQKAAPMSLSITFNDGNVTRIDSLDADINIDNSTFNLKGMKVDGSAKGMIIKSGKKYLQK